MTQTLIHNHEQLFKIARLGGAQVILFTGPTGVGKTHLARLFRDHSPRSNRIFLDLNCAELNEDVIEAELFGTEKGAFTGAIQRKGKFEAAHGGTIFLDEIGELDRYIQAKLLKVIEEDRIYRVGGNKSITTDVQIICATNRDKADFRPDFWQRISGYTFELLALSERKHEIVPFAEQFLADVAKEKHCVFLYKKEDLLILTEARWEGNIRELQNFIRRLCYNLIVNHPSFEAASNASTKHLNLKLEIKPNDILSALNLKNRALQTVKATEIIRSEILPPSADLESSEETDIAPKFLLRSPISEATEFLKICEQLKSRGLSSDQLAIKLGLKRRTFFYRLRKSRELVESAGLTIPHANLSVGSEIRTGAAAF